LEEGIYRFLIAFGLKISFSFLKGFILSKGEDGEKEKKSELPHSFKPPFRKIIKEKGRKIKGDF
jgi:hypothetical protein